MTAETFATAMGNLRLCCMDIRYLHVMMHSCITERAYLNQDKVLTVCLAQPSWLHGGAHCDQMPCHRSCILTLIAMWTGHTCLESVVMCISHQSYDCCAAMCMAG